MWYAVGVVAWLAVGAVVGLVQARRGHWRNGWVFYAIFGPLAILLALQHSVPEPAEPVVLGHGATGPGQVDVLVGLDGSAAALGAARLAADLFGSHLHRLTLAAVLDVETGADRTGSLMHPEPWPEERQARQMLDEAADLFLRTSGHDVRTVLLTGEPATTLVDYAHEQGYHVIVAGTRGQGLSRALLGSCASRLAKQSTVPVLLIPETEDTEPQPDRSEVSATGR